MEFRNVGNSGLRVSVAGLGCNQFGSRLDVGETRRVVHRALDLGVTLLDTADAYGSRGGSEAQLGEILGTARRDVVLATKFGWEMDDAGALRGGARGYVMRAVEDSLRRLRTDWIDLYQFHKPDQRTPIEETLRALDDLVTQGKVRYVGCSNFAAWQLADADWTSRAGGLARFVSAQNEYSALVRDAERDLGPALAHFGIGLLPYYPLAGGLLSGKYRRDAQLPAGSRLAQTKRSADRFLTERNWRVVDELVQVAESCGRSLLDVAVGWVASRPFVASVIAGATSPEQVEANVAACTSTLDAQTLARVDRATSPPA
ncbi:MAG: aldo/keto reductase [Burkholderiales bacterium]|nr:aldo/keto reductase [Burkholderiales bacterium]GIK85222.1 MAG: oxidoreductase [Betaproteobacteria bacterium]